MKLLKSTITALNFLIVISACNHVNINYNSDSENSEKIIGEGEPVEQIMEVGSFSKIECLGAASITVRKGDQQKIIVRAQQNIIGAMSFEVSGNKLNIGIDEEYNIDTDKGIDIDIEVPNNIEGFSITGAGNIEYFSTNQQYLSITIMGAGNFNSNTTEVSNCKVSINGAGNCDVFVTDQLEVNISGVGNVFYKGEPSIKKNISGLGTVISKN